MQPCGERPGSRIEELRPIPHCEKRLLDHLFGDLPVGGQPARRGVDGTCVTVIQRRKGGLRSGRDRVDECGIVRGRRHPAHEYAPMGTTVSCRWAQGLIGSAEGGEPAKPDLRPWSMVGTLDDSVASSPEIGP